MPWHVQPIEVLDRHNYDDWQTVFSNRDRLSASKVDQPTELIFRVLGSQGLHATPRYGANSRT